MNRIIFFSDVSLLVYSNETDSVYWFYILDFYSIHWWGSIVFGWFQHIRSHHLQKQQFWWFSFWLGCHLFHCFIWLHRVGFYVLCQISVGIEHHCLVSDIRKDLNYFNFSLLSIMLAVGWSYIFHFFLILSQVNHIFLFIKVASGDLLCTFVLFPSFLMHFVALYWDTHIWKDSYIS